MAEPKMVFRVYVLVERIAIDPETLKDLGDELTEEVTDGFLMIGDTENHQVVTSAIARLSNTIQSGDYSRVSAGLTEAFKSYRSKGN